MSKNDNQENGNSSNGHSRIQRTFIKAASTAITAAIITTDSAATVARDSMLVNTAKVAAMYTHVAFFSVKNRLRGTQSGASDLAEKITLALNSTAK